jgi:asparagine synthase (glutamine-hydrolysing)
MCGIYGIVATSPDYRPDPAWLAPMAGAMVHRGPDDDGVFADANIAFGMRRLSIIDLAHGHQPIANEDETVWVVCNGEIYNFPELRKRLIDRGHRFRTASDTEVIVHLYEDLGPGCVAQLKGMFGLAIWDTRHRRLVIARDHLGVKPIYFLRDQRRLIFASEAKSILKAPEVTAEVDAVGLQEYLTLGYTPSTQSIFKGIEKLPPGSLLVCEGGKIEISQFWRLNNGHTDRCNEAQWAERILDKIRSSVVAEMVSDVPLGAFLSGGIDSSSIVAMMAASSAIPVKTYSIGFDTGGAASYYNELPYAQQVATLFNTDHKEILVRPNVAELLPRLLWHMDEPVADSAFITTYLVAKFAREDVTVILSGVGGDEIFGGYRRYLGEYYAGKYQRLPGVLRRRVIAPLVDALPKDRHSKFMDLARLAGTFIRSAELPLEQRYRSYVEVFGAESLDRLLASVRNGYVDSLDQAFDVAAGGAGIDRLMNVDLMTQLPNDLLMLTDKMTMAASIECRVPLLNFELVEMTATMPPELKINGRTLKYALKKALAPTLPASILHRKKRGFGAPMGAWLKQELAPLMSGVLSREAVERRGLLNWDVVQRTVEMHNANRADHTDHLLSLLNFEIWARIYLDGRTPDDVAVELAGFSAP